MANKHPHIPIAREDDCKPRRKRPGHGSSPAPRNERTHAKRLLRSTRVSLNRIKHSRVQHGVSANRLLVFEVNSTDRSIRETLEKRFSVSVVDERVIEKDPETGEKIRLIAQFENSGQFDQFTNEATNYQRRNQTQTLLTSKQRDRFFGGIEGISIVEGEEKKGPRIRENPPATSTFQLDIDFWHPGNQQGATEITRIVGECVSRYGGVVEETLVSSSLLLARVTANFDLLDALLTLDFVARIDLPPEAVHEIDADTVLSCRPPANMPRPLPSTPKAAVIDSGVQAGHPMLQDWVIEEQDFGTGEATSSDYQGHGTKVAGLVIHGDVSSSIKSGEWHPKVAIYSGKVLHSHPVSGDATFPSNSRPERLIGDAISYFAGQGCQVFCIAISNPMRIYSGGRQTTWAEMLDKAARTHDVVLVIPSGNDVLPPLPEVGNRVSFQERVRDNLLSSPQSRVCDPGTASLSLTVGSLSRTDSPHTNACLAGAPQSSPSPFTRVGPGYQPTPSNQAVKPDVVSFGGNYALQSLPGNNQRWLRTDIGLGEPTTRLVEGKRLVGSYSGTSFACARVAHIAARVASSLHKYLGHRPSANLIRSVVGLSTRIPNCGPSWLLDSSSSESAEKLRLVGYGLSCEDLAYTSSENSVSLIAEDSIPDDTFHIYRIVLPREFREKKGKRGLVVSLAFDPPTNATRREYLCRTMAVEVVKNTSHAEIINRRRSQTGRKSKEDNLNSKNLLKLRPTKSELEWSTLQVRRISWQKKISFPPELFVLVTCNSRIPTDEHTQRYGLSVRLWHSDENVHLYQKIKNRVRQPVPQRARVFSKTTVRKNR